MQIVPSYLTDADAIDTLIMPFIQDINKILHKNALISLKYPRIINR